MSNFEFYTTIERIKSVCPEFWIIMDLADEAEQKALLDRLQAGFSSPAAMLGYICERIYNK